MTTVISSLAKQSPACRAERGGCQSGPAGNVSEPCAGLAPLPVEVDDMASLLLEAEARGNITWLSSDNREAYDLIEREIALTPSGRNTHLVFGMIHDNIEVYAYLYELVAPGNDGRQINGLTRLAAEYPRFAPDGSDAQQMIDLYLATGNSEYRPRPGFSGEEPRVAGFREIMIEMVENARDRGLDLILAGVEISLNEHWLASLGWDAWLSARDSFAVKLLEQRLAGAQGEVIVWYWGTAHAAGTGLPFHLSLNDPEARITSLVLNGGATRCNYSVDHAVSRLGWEERGFILALPDRCEAQYLIQLPLNSPCEPDRPIFFPF